MSAPDQTDEPSGDRPKVRGLTVALIVALCVLAASLALVVVDGIAGDERRLAACERLYEDRETPIQGVTCKNAEQNHRIICESGEIDSTSEGACLGDLLDARYLGPWLALITSVVITLVLGIAWLLTRRRGPPD